MPATGPNETILNVNHLIEVTQRSATTTAHRNAFKEVVRIVNLADNDKGARGKNSRKCLTKLKSELLAHVDVGIELTHFNIPDAYFAAMSPRYLKPPPGSRFSMLRIKIGHTRKLPFTCLELLDRNDTFLPWITVDSKDGGYKKCSMHFKDYAGLVRHLATRHDVLWLSFQCPWCCNIGFEKTKITRHVASCSSMPGAVAKFVESIENADENEVILENINAARGHLGKVIQNDIDLNFERRVSLTMTRAESKFRNHAERAEKGVKDRWPKSWKPDDPWVNYEDETGLYSTRSHKFPFLVRCPGVCQQIFMDTQMASKAHLLKCDLKGFTNYHSQKILDEAITDKVDRLIFDWKKEADRRAKLVKDFVPEVSITVDGYGGTSIHKVQRKPLIDIMKKESVPIADNVDIRARGFVKRAKNKRVVGGLRVVYQPGQEDLKAILAEELVNMPAFKKKVAKRKASIEDFSDENLKRKCTRRSSHHELFDAAWNEYNEYLDEKFEKEAMEF